MTDVCVHLPRKEENLARDILKELRQINYHLNRLCIVDELYIEKQRESTIAVIPTENITIGHGELSTREVETVPAKGEKDYGDPS